MFSVTFNLAAVNDTIKNRTEIQSTTHSFDCVDPSAEPSNPQIHWTSKPGLLGFGIGSTTEALNLAENSKKIIDEMSQRTQQAEGI
jgi:hypothetical protein